MAGIPAGRLNIEIVAEVAKLDADLRRIKSAVNAASGDIARSAKAANDNLAAIGKGAGAGVQQLSREFAYLKGALDPAWQAQQKFNQQQDLGMRAFRAGAIDRQQFIAHMRQINAELKSVSGPMQKVTAVAGQQKQGMQQLGFQINDVATQFASGTPPMQIFAQQAGQVAQSVQLMAGGTSKFAAFMGGPWGIALTAATVVLVTLVGKFLMAEDATKKADKATRSFTEVLNDSKSSWDEVTKAAKEYADQQVKSRELTIDQIESEANLIGMRQGHARVLRLLLDAELEMAKLRTELATESASPEAMIVARSKLVGIEERIKKNKEAQASLDRAAIEVAIKAADEIAKLRTDEEYRLKSGFDLQRKRARESIHDVQELAERQAQINRAQEAALDKLREKGKAASDEALKLSKVTGAEIAKALGTSINSQFRTAAQNKAAGGAANSYHLTGQAIDIPLTVNGKPITKAWIRQMLEPLGVQIKELLGPGDKNHDDHFHIAFGVKRLTPDQVADAQEDARKAAEKVAEAWNKVLDDLAISVVQARVDTASQVEKLIGDAAGKDWDAMMADINAQKQIRAAEREEEYAALERNRNLALGAAHDIADIIGGGIGEAAHALIDAVFELDKTLFNVSEGLGKALKAFSAGSVLGGSFAGATGGSRSGGSIGGGLAGAAFEKFAGEGLKNALGAFGGPLAGIAGGIIGGLIGGLLTSTPRASATVSIIAGKAMETAITGNSGKLQKIASGMADGLIAGLEKIAESLGATIAGNASVSVGIRKGNYRVDPTGQGITKTSRGAIDFGDDKAAAQAYAMLLAIRQLDFTGVSASVKTLLTLTDDLETNLSKATQFKAVFDELAKRDDPAKFAQDEITRWYDAMAKIFAEAGATGEELAELERLTGLKRVDAAKEANEAIEKAAKDAADLAKQQATTILGIQADILDVQGKTTEAQKIRDQLELDGLDPIIAGWKETYFAARDAAKAATDLAEAQRQQQETADAAAKAARDLQMATAKTEGDLLLRLYRATGQTGAADMLEAQRFLGELPEELRALGEAVLSAERAGAQASNQSQGGASLARNDNSIGPAVAKAAADLSRLFDLENQLLRLQGKELEAVAREREAELKTLTATEAAIMRQIYALQDAKLAEEERTKAIEEAQSKVDAARNTLLDSYNREADVLGQTKTKLVDAIESMQALRDTIWGGPGSPESVAALQAKFLQTAALAKSGDVDAMGKLSGIGSDFLSASSAGAPTYIAKALGEALVARTLDEAIKAGGEALDYNKLQLEALDRSVDGLIDINESVISVKDAIAELKAEMAELRKEQRAANGAIAANTGKTARKLEEGITTTDSNGGASFG